MENSITYISPTTTRRTPRGMSRLVCLVASYITEFKSDQTAKNVDGDNLKERVYFRLGGDALTISPSPVRFGLAFRAF